MFVILYQRNAGRNVPLMVVSLQFHHLSCAWENYWFAWYFGPKSKTERLLKLLNTCVAHKLLRCESLWFTNITKTLWFDVLHFTCLFSDTNCVSSCLRETAPELVDTERVTMSSCSRCMPFGGLRRERRGWWRYCAPWFSFRVRPVLLEPLSLPPPFPELSFVIWKAAQMQCKQSCTCSLFFKIKILGKNSCKCLKENRCLVIFFFLNKCLPSLVPDCCFFTNNIPFSL